MHIATVGTTFRIVSHVVLLLMVAAIAYAGFITLSYWNSVGV